MAVFLARIVMPRSRSRSLESMISSPAASGSRKMCDCLSRPSTSVVLPWSTWAMMATLRNWAAETGAEGAAVGASMRCRDRSVEAEGINGDAARASLPRRATSHYITAEIMETPQPESHRGGNGLIPGQRMRSACDLSSMSKRGGMRQRMRGVQSQARD